MAKANAGTGNLLVLPHANASVQNFPSKIASEVCDITASHGHMDVLSWAFLRDQ